MAKRLTRGRFLLKWMKINPGIPVIWSDEKLFTVEMDFNHHNDRVLSVRVEDIPVDQRTVFKRQSPASVMVWAGVTSDGRKTPLIFIEEGVKVNQNV